MKISMNNIVIQNSDNNKDDELSALFGFYGTNSNEQRKAYHDTITISNDANYINSTDPWYIEFTDMKFFDFENELCIKTLNQQAFKKLSLDVYLTNSIFSNDDMDSDLTDTMVIYGYNILILNECDFTNHSYINLYSGELNSTNDNTITNDLNLIIEYCTFTNYTSDAALYIRDFVGTSYGYKIYENSFSNVYGDTANLLHFSLISNNYDSIYESYAARIMIEKNNFTNCDVSNDHKDVTDNYNVSSLVIYDRRITDNNASYLIKTNFSGTRCSVSINNCIFENNNLINE